MTDEQVTQFLQSIVSQAVELQAYVSLMDEQERDTIHDIERDIDSLLDYLQDERQTTEVFDSFSGRIEQRDN